MDEFVDEIALLLALLSAVSNFVTTSDWYPIAYGRITNCVAHN